MQAKGKDGKREDEMMRYDTEIDFNSRNAMTIFIDLIKDHAKILEFGPASGRLTKYLKENKSCEVFIVEIDQDAAKMAIPYAQEYLIGDIMEYQWLSKFSEERFDYILFADVLEHLEKPDEALAQAKTLLKDDGKILISLPNIAYNGVLLNLYHNIFKYSETGILDRTHLHFWSLDEAVHMFRESGYGVELVDATYNPLINSEFQSKYESLPCVVADAVKSRAYGEVYQLIFMLVKNQHILPTDKIIKHMDYLYLQIFFDKGNGWDIDEERKYPAEFGEEVCFEVRVPETASAFRLDPLNAECIVRVRVLNQTDQELRAINMNGVCFEDVYCFDHKDPQIIYEIPSGTKAVKIQVDYIVYHKNYVYQWVCRNLQKQNNVIEQKEDYIQELRERIENESRKICEQNNIIEQKENYICEQREIIGRKEDEISKQREVIRQKENDIFERQKIIAQKENEIIRQQEKLKQYEAFLGSYGIRQLYCFYQKIRSGEMK